MSSMSEGQNGSNCRSAAALVLPRGLRRVTSVLLGLVLALLTVVKVLDMGFFAVLDRPFDPVYDWYYLRPAVGVLGDSVGQGAAMATVAAAGVLLVVVLVLMPLSVARLSGQSGSYGGTVGAAST